jgi:hypothetical protein
MNTSEDQKVQLFNNYYLNLIAFSLFNIFLYITALGAIMDIAPPRLDWIHNYSLIFCLIAGIMTAIISTGKTQELAIPKRIFESSIASILGLTVILALYFVSLVIYPEQYVSIESFQSTLNTIGLNDNQLNIVEKAILSKGFITIEEVNKLGLNEIQKTDLLNTLKNYNYVTDKQVVNIIATQDTIKATESAIATQEAKISTCFIETEADFHNVAIRDQPSVTIGKSISYLVEGEKLKAVGHNGGKININRWWLVEFGKGDEQDYGWVSSYYVNEINEISCLQLPQTPGSSQLDDQ